MKDLISKLFSQQLIASLADTLIYSLLAGVVLVVLAGIIVISTRKASAAARYNWLTGLLAVFAVGMLFVFIWQYNNDAYRNDTARIQVVQQDLSNEVAYPITNYVPVKKDQLAVIKDYLDQHHNMIVLIWLLVIVIRSVQLMVGLQGVYHLRTKGVTAVNEVWADAFRQMTKKLGIKQKVGILASGLTQVPMAVGYLKPLVLIPIGLMTALSTAEIEAILLHELAHIRRRDYLVNLLQNMLEILFFFNPAVLWVSKLIRSERENCCDDLALSHNSSRNQYIRALVNFEEIRSGAGGYAMAMSGNNNGLMGRVKRLINKQNYSLNPFEKTLLTICLVVAGIGFSAFAGKEHIKRAADAIVKAIIPEEKPIRLEPIKNAKKIRPFIIADTAKITLPKPREIKDSVIAKNFTVKKYYSKAASEDTVVDIHTDHVYTFKPKWTDSTLNQRYQAWLVEQKTQRVAVPGNLTDAELDDWYDRRIQDAKDHRVDSVKVFHHISKISTTVTTAASNIKGSNQRYGGLVFLDSTERDYYDFKLDRGKKVNDSLTHIPRTRQEQMAFELARDGIIASDDRSLNELRAYFPGHRFVVNDNDQSEELRKRYWVKFSQRTHNPKFAAEPYKEHSHILNRIILTLIKDKLVAKDDYAIDNLTFKLDSNGLIVNGKKQPAKTFKKYYDVFIKPSSEQDVSWVYGEASK